MLLTTHSERPSLTRLLSAASQMLSLLLDQLVQQSLISAAAATKSRALLEVYEHQGDTISVVPH